ncbi:hypothetical protein CDD81_6318 [Ophiocordyceps australis]|uniref:Uncharacterized protein n=1 Tax=Ophiocordyceps australis TaxID=1399860 RepID=A0A2C5Y620_9HYPO|nr:hypothetical protein CDD81_6318 [Ophiocordyceps australis]
MTLVNMLSIGLLLLSSSCHGLPGSNPSSAAKIAELPALDTNELKNTIGQPGVKIHGLDTRAALVDAAELTRYPGAGMDTKRKHKHRILPFPGKFVRDVETEATEASNIGLEKLDKRGLNQEGEKKTLEKRKETPFQTDMTKWGGRLAPISDEDFCVHVRSMEWLAHRLIIEVKEMKPPHNLTVTRAGLSNQPADNQVYLVAKLMRIWLQLMRVLNLQLEWSEGIPNQNHCAVCYAGYALKTSDFLVALRNQAELFYLRDPVRPLIGGLLEHLHLESKNMAWVLLLRPRGNWFEARQAHRTESVWGDKMFRLYGTKPGHHLSKFLRSIEPLRSDRWLRGGLFRTAAKAWHFDEFKAPRKSKRQWPPYEVTDKVRYDQAEIFVDPDERRWAKPAKRPLAILEPPWGIGPEETLCKCPVSDEPTMQGELRNIKCRCNPGAVGKRVKNERRGLRGGGPGTWAFGGTLPKDNASVVVLNSELLLPRPHYVLAGHREILDTLLLKIVNIMSYLQFRLAPECRGFEKAIHHWTTMLHLKDPRNKVLRKKQFWDAMHALEDAALVLKSEPCDMLNWDGTYARGMMFDLGLEVIQILAIVLDAGGYDGISAELNDYPWVVVHHLIDLSNIDVTKPARVQWADDLVGGPASHMVPR